MTVTWQARKIRTKLNTNENKKIVNSEIRLIHNTTYIYITDNKLDSVERTFTIQLNEFKVNDVTQMLTPSTNKSIRG